MENRTEIKVRGYHLDMYSHVNNARYLEFLEEGRWAFLDKDNCFQEWPKDILFFVVNINITFRRPASFGDILEVRTRLSEIGKKSAVMGQDIVHKESGATVANAEVTFVLADARTRRAVPIEGEIRKFLEKLNPS
jgi:thioesterase-3